MLFPFWTVQAWNEAVKTHVRRVDGTLAREHQQVVEESAKCTTKERCHHGNPTISVSHVRTGLERILTRNNNHRPPKPHGHILRRRTLDGVQSLEQD